MQSLTTSYNPFMCLVACPSFKFFVYFPNSSIYFYHSCKSYNNDNNNFNRLLTRSVAFGEWEHTKCRKTGNMYYGSVGDYLQ